MFSFRQILEKKWEYSGALQQPFIDFKKTYDLVTFKVLCNILIEFGSRMKLFGLIPTCFNENTGRQILCNMFPFRNFLTQGDAFLPLFF
jgi:hypothetical protein